MTPPQPFCRCHQLRCTIAIKSAYLLLWSHEVIESKVGFFCSVFRRRITRKPSSVSVAHKYSKNVAILAHAIVDKDRVGGNLVSKFLGTVSVRVGGFFAFLSAMPVLHFGALANLEFWMLRHVRHIMILWHIRRFSGAIGSSGTASACADGTDLSPEPLAPPS